MSQVINNNLSQAPSRKSIVMGNLDELMKDVQSSLKRIEEIKLEIGEDYDNISNPVPLFEMLPDSSHDMSGALASTAGL